MTWTTALPDWEKRITKGQSILPCKPLNQSVADIALNIFKQLKLVDVIGEPTIGEVADPWILDFVSVIFGAYDPETKRRYIRYFYLLISKKNSKSSYAAAIMLTALILNERKQAKLYIVAPTKEVAGNSFTPVTGMINADERLKKLFNISTHEKTITHRGTEATLKVLAAEGDTVSGIKGLFVLFDEIHEFGKRANASKVFLEAEGGLKTFQDGFVIYLTTHSSDEPVGIHKKLLDYARAVLSGEVVDKSFLPLMYEMPRSMVESGKHLDPKNWKISNPNMGKSVHLDELKIAFQKADFNGQEEITDFLAKHVNVEVGMALAHNGWAGAEYWKDACQDFTLDELIEMSEVLTVGIDGGGLDDLFGLAVLGRLKGTDIWWLWVHSWCHEVVFDRHKQIVPLLEEYVKDGDLTVIKNYESDSDRDYKEASSLVLRLHNTGKLASIGLDEARIAELLRIFEEDEIPSDILFGIKQGWRLMGAIQSAERRLAGKKLIPANQSMMRWCVGNAKVKDTGATKSIVKQQPHRKIDPLMATFNAVELMCRNPEPPTPKHNIDEYLDNMVIA